MSAYAPYKYNPGEMSPGELKASFVGRRHLLDRLMGALSDQTDADTIQHYLLLGPRGVGKTTLLHILRMRIKANPVLSTRWLPVLYREEEFYAYTLRDLLALALEHLHIENNIHEAGRLLEEADAETDDEKSLAKIIDGLRNISKSHRARILLLIDNFDLIFPKQVRHEMNQRSFRKLLSTERFLMVIGTSTLLFEDIFAYDQAFFNFFAPVNVENLGDDEIEQLLRTRATLDENRGFLGDYEKNEKKIKAITYLTGGNPRLVVMLYDILSRGHLLPVVEALRETMDNLTPLFKDILEDLPRQQSKILDALMRLGGAASPSEIAEKARLRLNTVTVQLGRLKSSKLIEAKTNTKDTPGIYRISDQMFRTWYQMRYLRPARRRVEMFVEFLRAWFSIEERLSSLEHLRKEFRKYVSSGQRRLAREMVHSMEYFAASLDPTSERTRSLEYVANAHLEGGSVREAAPSLADAQAQEQPTPSGVRGEAAGYAMPGTRHTGRGRYTDAIAAFTEALNRDEKHVRARIGLGLSLGLIGEHQKALEQFNIAMKTEDLDAHLLGIALLARSDAKSSLTDYQGSMQDCDAVLQIEGTFSERAAIALFQRGFCKRRLGDHQGAMEDYTAILQIEGVSPDQIADALLDRGGCRYELGDYYGAIEDYTAASQLEGTSPDQTAKAIVCRGAAYVMMGDDGKALEECESASRISDISPEAALFTLRLRALVRENLGHIDEAIADYRYCAENGKDVNAVQKALSSLIRLLCNEGKTDQAADWMSRMHELEPEGISMEQRLEGRIVIITVIAKECSLELADLLLETVSKSADTALRDKLDFLKSGLTFAKSGDESILSKLPEEEQQMAKHIAETIRAH